MLNGDIIADRLLKYAADCIKFSGTLPKTYIGRHISGQLVRAATSAGANYEEARGAESKADFIHKMQVVLKELRESRYWLRLITAAEIISNETVKSLQGEADELIRIFSKSVATAKRKRLEKAVSGQI